LGVKDEKSRCSQTLHTDMLSPQPHGQLRVGLQGRQSLWVSPDLWHTASPMPGGHPAGACPGHRRTGAPHGAPIRASVWRLPSHSGGQPL